jgi:hypothetical protein
VLAKGKQHGLSSLRRPAVRPSYSPIYHVVGRLVLNGVGRRVSQAKQFSVCG